MFLSPTGTGCRIYLTAILSVLIHCFHQSLTDGKVRHDVIKQMGIAQSIKEIPLLPVGGSSQSYQDGEGNEGSFSGPSLPNAREPDVTSLIANGDRTYPGEFRHQAILMVETSRGLFLLCGASIIGPRHAMTAAHCIFPYMEGRQNRFFPHFIGVGFNNRTLGVDSPHAQMAKVTHYRRPRRYVEFQSNDLAILYLDRDIIETDYVKYGKLATPALGLYINKACFISGWGRNEDDELQEMLHFAETWTTSKQECEDMWAIQRAKITNKLVCVWNYPKTTCRGDSGGPLTCGDLVVGVSSWSNTKCNGCYPQGFTRVSRLYGWIQNALRSMEQYTETVA